MRNPSRKRRCRVPQERGRTLPGGAVPEGPDDLQYIHTVVDVYFSGRIRRHPMARRTKEEAQATRNRILDTAEMVFQRRGVSRTTLQEVAEAAGVTRGAIYWHFRDKAELFNAMMERVILPLEQQALHGPAPDDPLEGLRRSFVDAMRRAVSDAQVRRVFEIASHKVEYVDELEAVRDRRLASREVWVAHSERSLRRR